LTVVHPADATKQGLISRSLLMRTPRIGLLLAVSAFI
jgi:hypothetical protein